MLRQSIFKLNRGLSHLDYLLRGHPERTGSAVRAGSVCDGVCGSWRWRMSDQLGKFELHVRQEFARVLAAIGGVYLAVCYLDYVDAEYGLWLTWLLTPLVITFLLPAMLILLIYTSAIIFHVYRLYRRRLVRGVQGDWRSAARLAVCALWDAHGWLWHGYEISGLENIPDEPCLIIYYHGALPIDMYYFIGRMYLLRRRMIYTVADRFMFKIPGWSIMLDGLCVIPGTVQTCTGILRAGSSLAISPGGVYEAQFGDHRYELNWQARTGFAKVALEAKVPIVPMFTQNVREAFRTVGWLRWVWLRIYQATRIPLAPVYGGFPVKLVTHLGKPIPYDPALTPQQLQHKVAQAIEDLKEEHQRVPGSILRALTERVYRVPKKPKKAITSNGTCNGQIPRSSITDGDIRRHEKYKESDGDRDITELPTRTNMTKENKEESNAKHKSTIEKMAADVKHIPTDKRECAKGEKTNAKFKERESGDSKMKVS